MSNDEINQWIDSLPLSRKRKNLARDFSDACLMAEVIHVFQPKMVDLHNYETALRVDTKAYNWNTLNQKAFKKLGIPLDQQTVQGLANAKPGYIEKVLAQAKIALTTPGGSKPSTAKSESSRSPKGKAQPPPPPQIKKMDDQDRELLIQKIYEGQHNAEMIRALEAKSSKMLELLRVKDAKIIRLIAKKSKTAK